MTRVNELKMIWAAIDALIDLCDEGLSNPEIRGALDQLNRMSSDYEYEAERIQLFTE